MNNRGARGIELFTRYEAPHDQSEENRNSIQILRVVNFANPKVGWALGGEQILLTRDGGYSWQNRYPSAFREQYLGPVAIHPIDSNCCWVLATYVSHEARCFYTEDAGRSWTEKYRFFSTKYRIIHLDLFFADPMHGWVLCGEMDGRKTHISVHLTMDGGTHWNRVPLKVRGEPKRIRFIDAKLGWFIETHRISPAPRDRFDTTVHRTLDGGLNWSGVVRLKGYPTDLYVLNRHVHFIAGTRGWLARSVDSGETWEMVRSGSQMNVEGIHFRGQTGIAVGSADLVHSRRSVLILLSGDLGRTWKRIESPISAALFAVYLTAWDRGVMAAADGLYQFRLR